MLPRLTSLTMKVLEDRISSATLNLLELSQEDNITLEDFDTGYLEPACRHIGEMINNVPSSLANEVTDKMLHAVISSYYKFLLKESIEFKRVLKDATRFVADIACSVLHPFTTKFCCADWIFPDHIATEYFDQFIFKALNKMQRVKSLRLEMYTGTEFPTNCKNKLILKDNKGVQNVEELTIYGLKMDNLHRHFKGLKKLIIGHQFSWSWEDAEISILQLKHLEYLDVVQMKFNQEQMSNLIEGLSNVQAETQNNIRKRHPLKVFKFVNWQSETSRVVSCFPYLVSVKIVLVSWHNLNVLKGLSQLKSLDVHSKISTNFQSIFGEFLKECGYRILELKLANIFDTDLNFVAQYCPSLEKLCLYDCDEKLFRDPPSFRKIYPYVRLSELDEFPSVQIFEFNVHFHIAAPGDTLWKIISKCVNVKMVQVIVHHGFTLRFLKKLAENLENVQFEINQELGDAVCAKGNELWGILNSKFPKWMLT